MENDYYNDEYMDDSHIPRLYIESMATVQDIELELMSNHDEFYRRIVTYMIETIENTIPVGEPLAILVDEGGAEYDMELGPEGYLKSLNKCMEYFSEMEEYETCTLIKDLIRITEDGLL